MSSDNVRRQIQINRGPASRALEAEMRQKIALKIAIYDLDSVFDAYLKQYTSVDSITDLKSTESKKSIRLHCTLIGTLLHSRDGPFPMTDCFDLGLSNLRPPQSPVAAAALNWWKRSGGHVDNEFNFENSVLCYTSRDTEISPQYFWIGVNAPVTQCSGTDWAKRALAHAVGTPNAVLEKVASAGYLQASDGHPRFDIMTVSAEHCPLDDSILSYFRLILPVYGPKGTRLLAVFTDWISRPPQLPWQGEQDQPTSSIQASHSDQSSRALQSSVSPLVLRENSLAGRRNPAEQVSC